MSGSHQLLSLFFDDENRYDTDELDDVELARQVVAIIRNEDSREEIERELRELLDDLDLEQQFDHEVAERDDEGDVDTSWADHQEELLRRAGSFTKLLRHDPEHGLLTEEASEEEYETLREAIETNDRETLDDVTRANEGLDAPRLWINPRASNAASLKGYHPSLIGDTKGEGEDPDYERYEMEPPPELNSPEAAVEMLEAYLFAVCRDVDFADYGTGRRTDSPDTYDHAFTTLQAAEDSSDLEDQSETYDSITHWAADQLEAALEAMVEQLDEIETTREVASKLDIPVDTEEDELITPDVLFRGDDRGHDTTVNKTERQGTSRTGPFHSQFLLQQLYPLFPSGCAPYVAQATGVPELDLDEIAVDRYVPIANRREFGTTWEDFVAIQDGDLPQTYVEEDFEDDEGRYPIRGRDMGTHVHTDGPYQEYYRAATVLLFWDFPRTELSPYAGTLTERAENEADGVTFGPIDAFSIVGSVAYEAFKAAWVQKWRAFRRLRPEAYAGLVDVIYNREDRSLPSFDGDKRSVELSELLDPDTYNFTDRILSVVADYNQRQSNYSYLEVGRDAEHDLDDPTISNYLLGQMYPEGSPTHPAYPSGHATVAGACVTVLKALFDDTAPITATDMRPVAIDPEDPTEHVFIDRGPHARDGVEEMTVASELDKLASNIAHARMFGGVHFRSDGERGIRLGEQVAIRFIQDHLLSYPEEEFQYDDGDEFEPTLEFKTRDGDRLAVTPEEIRVRDE